MLRGQLLQIWLTLSDEDVEEAIYDSYAKSKAWEWANTRKSYWRLANSWFMALPVEHEASFSKEK